MRDSGVLLVGTEAGAFEALARKFPATRSALRITDAAASGDLDRADLLVLSLEELARAIDDGTSLLLSRTDRLSVLIGTDRPRRDQIAKCLRLCPANHWITAPPRFLADEIAFQLANQRHQITLEGCLGAGQSEEQITLRMARDRKGALVRFEQYLASITTIEGRSTRLLTGVNELLSNAFDAMPAHGSDEQRSLVLSYGTDGRWLGACVEDHAGRLDASAVRQALSRAWLRGRDQLRMETSGGAGVGLFMTQHSVDRLVFGLKPGVRTRVVMLLDILRPATQASNAGSLHLFTEQ